MLLLLESQDMVSFILILDKALEAKGELSLLELLRLLH